MRWKKYSFLAHRKTVRIDGFEINRLISVCMKQHIRFKNLIYIDDTRVEAVIKVNLKQIGILGKSKEDILEELETIYR